MNYVDNRKRLLAWIRKQLIGPASRQNTLQGKPLDRYPTGVLFPILCGDNGIDPALTGSGIEDEDNETRTQDKPREKISSVISPRLYIPPSSVGFSFFVQGSKVCFQVLFSAVRYKKTADRNEHGQYTGLEYERIILGGDEEALFFEQPDPASKRLRQRQEIFNQRGGIDVLWRSFGSGWIITISLFNQQKLEPDAELKKYHTERNEKSFFEVKLRCIPEAGEIGTYPQVDRELLSPEELELELQYKARHIYAVGHGAAVNWRVDQGKVREIETEFLPEVEVPQVTADVMEHSSDQVLGLAHFASVENETEYLTDLSRFVEAYGNWTAGQKDLSLKFDPEERQTAQVITSRMDTALHRMRRGVMLLQAGSMTAKAFRLANQAMLDQMKKSDRAAGKLQQDKIYKWRPFQLAFLLMTIESAVDEDDDFRDIVDLIWFPTGGGKTEAYLGLAAFLIVWRRLKYSASGGGTTVLMRYTLRLLTVQQYKRAARMICALELIRRNQPELGKEPISIGLWVGGATSPNTWARAVELAVTAGGNKRATRKLVLTGCPWCGAEFQAPDCYHATQNSFYFHCTNPECEFGKKHHALPVNVVDEALYDHPPTLLLATVDKFARLAWDERANAFFGKIPARPPELIIQDELHLIAGALGSVAGLYEAALDTVLTQRGIRPKYIASTATIRMAASQVKRLYGRRPAIFPPPGLSCDDSWFARTIPLDKQPGRLYVGYLAPMLNRLNCLAPLAAALYVAPETVFPEGELDRDELLDAWWTLIIYHGSLKGVGNSHNSFDNDIRDWIERLKTEISQPENNRKTPERSMPRIAQLTSLSSAEENNRIFSNLEQNRRQKNCLDAVLATNMISVGLDVDRLALMIINGQPLTTTEYIQAGSRVGRSRVPGLVFANYYRDQARSLSHYENFRPYHESFYRFVEPTSVTPYTYQARSRALHAALVIAVRHSCPKLLANNCAGDFDSRSNDILKVIEIFKRRSATADPERAADTADNIDRLVMQWHAKAAECRKNKRGLSYQVTERDQAKDRLLADYGDKITTGWLTLQSMRNVENTALLKTL